MGLTPVALKISGIRSTLVTLSDATDNPATIDETGVLQAGLVATGPFTDWVIGNAGSINGVVGVNGINGSDGNGGDGGDGGAGGSAVVLASGALNNSGTILGGSGGNGGSGGSGSAGGTTYVLVPGHWFYVFRAPPFWIPDRYDIVTISPGPSGRDGASGEGGTGVSLTSGSVVNHGTITGGGGAWGVPGSWSPPAAR